MPLEFPVGFLLGIGHESPLQQHPAAPSLPAQQEWAFLPFFFFLQQDMSALQQSFMSQQASAFWLVFWVQESGRLRKQPGSLPWRE